MNTKFKLTAYIVLLLLAAGFGWRFYANYSTVTRESAEAPTNDTPAVVTNGPVGATNNTGLNGVTTSNSAAAQTNQETTAPAPPVPPAHAAQGTMIAYLAAFILSMIGLGLMIAHDFTQIIGSVAVDTLLDDRGEGLRDPEYEKAEQTWANGNFLDAIQMMRDFLKNNPRAQYAALRIAEIYEKDLHNLLAAALEYEEVLKQRLPAERWGWAAVHLCNLYSKLGQQDKTRALLQRIVDEYPKTAAAKKARSRLGLAEPEPEPIAKDEGTVTDAETGENMTTPGEEEPPPDPPEPAEPPPPSLPPGFRPKK
jgi:TolA-binding protein